MAMLFASVGIFGVFLFLTYYLQGTLGFSPVKTGIAFLPLVAALAATAQVSNGILLPRFGPKPIVPVGLLISAAALFGLHPANADTVNYIIASSEVISTLAVMSGLRSA